MKENALFIGPSNRVTKMTLATQKLTCGDSFGKQDWHDWPTNSLVTRGSQKSEILLKSQQYPGRPFEQRGNWWGSRKLVQLQFVQRHRPEPIEQVGPRITPEEGKMFMDNNTTLDQWSLPWTIKSSMMKVVHGRPSDVHGRPNSPPPYGRIHNT